MPFQVFNILCVSAEPFTVEPEALEFLARHSFDFNRLIDSGVRYYPSTACPLRSLITEILSRGAPLILHNGLVDLAFIYHHFYSPTPDCYGEFCNALADLFPSDSPTRMAGSFLEYVFRKWSVHLFTFFLLIKKFDHFSQGDNVREELASRWHLKITFDDTALMMAPLRNACERVNCQLPAGFPEHVVPCDLKGKVCEQFSNHGFCRKQRQGQCNLLHDVDYAIDLENEKLEKNRKKRKRR
ncbi:unnamed protein product [Strongylus vulgaris]|uniref:C3H1-type domain-containing protein n=1 Tax=Strongylus vulgaris TaxID=40348 RepID=A0A3P7J1U3_STRVU|nr:unnamed protein product [Strongylus vulgaris]